MSTSCSLFSSFSVNVSAHEHVSHDSFLVLLLSACVHLKENILSGLWKILAETDFRELQLSRAEQSKTTPTPRRNLSYSDVAGWPRSSHQGFYYSDEWVLIQANMAVHFSSFRLTKLFSPWQINHLFLHCYVFQVVVSLSVNGRYFGRFIFKVSKVGCALRTSTVAHWQASEREWLTRQS